MDELAVFGLLVLMAAGAGWQVRRLWGAEALAAFLIGFGIGCLIGIAVGRGYV